MLNALGLGAAGVFGMISISPSQIITAVYVALFGVVLLAFEMHIRRFEIWVVHNFGFMASFRGRAMYFLFTGSLCFGLGIIGIIVGCFGVCDGLFNFYIYYRREDVRKQLEQQTKEILEEVRKADNSEEGVSFDGVPLALISVLVPSICIDCCGHVFRSQQNRRRHCDAAGSQ